SGGSVDPLVYQMVVPQMAAPVRRITQAGGSYRSLATHPSVDLSCHAGRPGVCLVPFFFHRRLERLPDLLGRGGLPGDAPPAAQVVILPRNPLGVYPPGGPVREVPEGCRLQIPAFLEEFREEGFPAVPPFRDHALPQERGAAERFRLVVR